METNIYDFNEVFEKIKKSISEDENIQDIESKVDEFFEEIKTDIENTVDDISKIDFNIIRDELIKQTKDFINEI